MTRVATIILGVATLLAFASCGSPVDGIWIGTDGADANEYWLAFSSDFYDTETSDGHFEFVTLTPVEGELPGIYELESYYFGGYTLDTAAGTVTLNAAVVTYGDTTSSIATDTTDNVYATMDDLVNGNAYDPSYLYAPDNDVFKMYKWVLSDAVFTLPYEQDGQTLTVTLDDGTVVTCTANPERTLEMHRSLTAMGE